MDSREGFADRRLDVEHRLAVGIYIDRQPAAVDQAAEQQLAGERTADRVLDLALHRPGAHQRIEDFLCTLLAQGVGEGCPSLLLPSLGAESPE